MRRSAVVNLILLLAVVLAALIVCTDARGGRRGGSFGGIFGGWRKYKKPTSTTNSRRIINGSPMHTTATKINSGNPPLFSSPGMKTTGTQTKASYPKQQKSPYGASGPTAGSYTPSGAYIPPGGQYYATPQAIPPGAIFYAQPPRSGTGDLLMGMLTGHMISSMLFNRGPYVTHVYHQQQPQQNGDNGKVIIINNGESQNTTTDKVDWRYYPATEVPLAPFNDSLTPGVASESGHTTDSSQVQQPPGGIICMPLIFREPKPDNPEETVDVTKTVCYPAPPAPPTTAATPNCVMRTFIEGDPNDPTKTVEVERQTCEDTGTTEPPQVAGDIGDGIATEVQKNLLEETTTTTTADFSTTDIQ